MVRNRAKDDRAGGGDGAPEYVGDSPNNQEDSVEEASQMVNTLIEKSSLLKPIDDENISSMLEGVKEEKRGGKRKKTIQQKVKMSSKCKNIMDLGNEDEIKGLSDWTQSKYFKLLSVEEQFVLEQYFKDIEDGR
jgi:hypothetical protein